MSDIQVPDFAFPLRLGTGSDFAMVEQDSVDEIMQSVEVLLSTTRGSRVELPEYGIDDPSFTGVDLQDISDAIVDWEPRASVTLSDEIDSKDELIQHIRAEVETGDEE